MIKPIITFILLLMVVKILAVDAYSQEDTTIANKGEALQESNPSLVLTPPPILEGLTNSHVEVSIKKIDGGEDTKKLEEFLSIETYRTKVSILEISSEIPYWLDNISSMGKKSEESLLSWIENTLLQEYYNPESTNPIYNKGDSLLSTLLGGASKPTLIEGSRVIANLISNLFEPNQQNATIDRPIYSIAFETSPFSHKLVSIILVDPSPSSGPEKKSYIIVIDSTYNE